MIIGRFSILFFFLKRFKSSNPLISGNMTSNNIKSGVFLSTSSIAEVPSKATLHLSPFCESLLDRTSQLVLLSSTINMSESFKDSSISKL